MLKKRTKEEKNLIKLISAALGIVFFLIGLAIYMAKEGDIAGAHQIINIIPGFITNTFRIVFVIAIVSFLIYLVGSPLKFFK